MMQDKPKIVPAEVIKRISEDATEKLINELFLDERIKASYDEITQIVAKRLESVASEGFYDLVWVKIKSGDTRNYNKLGKKQQEILKSELKKEIIEQGYSIELGEDDYWCIHWGISWA